MFYYPAPIRSRSPPITADQRQPALSRPHFDPSYGLPDDPPEGQTWAEVERKLEASRNYWICTTRADGRPHAKPVWGVWVEDQLWFGSGERSVSGRNLARDPHVSVHLESGDDTVILEGAVEAHAPSAVPRAVREANQEKYGMGLEEAGGESPWFSLAPDLALTWLESDFLATAARWDFD